MMLTECVLVTGMTSNLNVKQKVWNEQFFSDHIVHSFTTGGFCLLPAQVPKSPYKCEEIEPLNKPPEVCTISIIVTGTHQTDK